MTESSGWWKKLGRWFRGGAEPHGPSDTPSPAAGFVRARTDLPEWAEVFATLDRLREFELLILKHFADRGIQIAYGDGALKPLEGFGDSQLSLTNLARVCAPRPQDQWPLLVREYFDGIQNGQTERKLQEEKYKTYIAAREALALRLWDEEAAESLEGKIVVRRDIPGLLTVLCLDFPDSIKSVALEEFKAWGVEEEQAFARAMTNLDRQAGKSISDVNLGGHKIKVLEDPSHYTASWALNIDRFEELMSVHGAFVALPTRHLLVTLPFGNASDLETLPAFVALSRQIERTSPGPLTHRVYWFDRSQWHEVPCEWSDHSVSVMPPPALAAVIRKLRGEDDSDDAGDNLSDNI